MTSQNIGLSSWGTLHTFWLTCIMISWDCYVKYVQIQIATCEAAVIINGTLRVTGCHSSCLRRLRPPEMLTVDLVILSSSSSGPIWKRPLQLSFTFFPIRYPICWSILLQFNPFRRADRSVTAQSSKLQGHRRAFWNCACQLTRASLNRCIDN
jgi:hypothetical protein